MTLELSRPNPRLAEALSGVSPGLACDVAIGVGHNLRLLSGLGWRVVGIETSDLALIHAERLLRNHSGAALLIQADPLRVALKEAAFDLVVCSFFLDRALMPRLLALVRPGGRFFFEAYDREHGRRHPNYPAEYCVADGEAPAFFDGFLVRARRIENNGSTLHSILALRPMPQERSAPERGQRVESAENSTGFTRRDRGASPA